MIIILSIISLSSFFILSLIYSGHFLILFFGFFLRLAILISQEANYENQAFNYYLIDNFIRAFSAISIIFLTKSLRNFSLKSFRFKQNFSSSIEKYAFNKKLILILFYSQLIFIGYVFIVSPDLSILSFNRTSTISLTLPGIRYVYPFFLALSPALFASSLLSIINFKQLRFNIFHYLILLSSLTNIFFLGQRGFLFITLFVSFLTSLLFSIYRLLKGKVNIEKIKYWFLIFILFPIIYNIRNLHVLNKDKFFNLQSGDLLHIKAWQGAIDALKELNTNIPPIFNNIFNFLNHQSRINLGIPNSSDIINTFLFSDFYFDKGFGLNITIPMDLYLSFNGNWLWVLTLLLFYIFILYRFIKSTKFFLFKNNNLPSYFLITCSFTLIFSGLGGWPLAMIFYLEAHLINFIQNNIIKYKNYFCS